MTIADEVVALRAENNELRAALTVLKIALKDGDNGNYWPVRKFLDERGVYNGDLNDLRALYAVTRAALEKKP